MQYAQIREMDISNGKGLGVSLFVQGCHIHCHNCFNSDLWDFHGGKPWTPKVENRFMQIIDRSYIKRVSILGGEPLSDENLTTVLHIVRTIKERYPNKTIWLYSGYTWENIFPSISLDELNTRNIYQQNILSFCDVMVDGQFVDNLKDLSLKFRGSSNQRIIDVQKSLENKSVVLWKDED